MQWLYLSPTGDLWICSLGTKRKLHVTYLRVIQFWYYFMSCETQIRPSKIKSRFHYRAHKYFHRLQPDLDFISWLFLLFLDTVVHRIEQVHSPGLSTVTGHLGHKVRCFPPFTKRKNLKINIQASWSALQAHLHLGLSKRSLIEQQPCRSLKGSLKCELQDEEEKQHFSGYTQGKKARNRNLSVFTVGRILHPQGSRVGWHQYMFTCCSAHLETEKRIKAGENICY